MSRSSHPLLPWPRTSFLGREHEIAEIERLLAIHSLVTLTGAAGSGKTRLAVQLLGLLSTRFGEDIYAADLAPLSDPSAVPETVAACAGVREVSGRTLIDALVEFIADRRVLLRPGQLRARA